MKIKVYETEQLDYFPLYPCTTDLNYAQEKVVRPEGFLFHQIFTVSCGSGIVRFGGEGYAVSKGDMFYIGTHIPHEYYGTDKNFKTSYLSFCGDGCEKIKRYYNVGDFGVYYNKNTAPFEEQLTRLFERFETPSELSAFCVEALAAVTAFFDEACKKKYTPIETVYNYIETNYAKMITLDDILTFYPYSKSKLCHDFKQAYKTSIFEMLMKTRIKNARYMLRSNPNIRLSEAAHSCGFNDVSYFCKAYKKLYGESPKNTK